jgi:hypothetical protein
MDIKTLTAKTAKTAKKNIFEVVAVFAVQKI